MIKSLILQTVKIGAVLVIGQMPYGKSTVGGEFVTLLKTGAEKAIGLYQEKSGSNSKKPRRKTSSDKGLDVDKMKKAFLPEDRLGD